MDSRQNYWNGKLIKQVLVQWTNELPEDVTCEDADALMNLFPAIQFADDLFLREHIWN